MVFDGSGGPRQRLKALVTAPIQDQELHELTELADVTVVPYPDEGLDDDVELTAAQLADADVLIVENAAVDAAILDAAPSLQLVVSCRSNPVNVDQEACARRGIVVEATPGRNADATADLAFGLLLNCVRRIPQAERWLRAGHWNPADRYQSYRTFRGMSLAGKTLGLIGLGAVGARVARRGAAFGMTVTAYDPKPASDPDFVELMAMDELLRNADVVSIHAPLTPSTVGLIGAEQLSLLKPGAYLINAARAALIDETALVDALSSGRLGGVGLDVFHEEPLPVGHRLLQFDNVVMTPHIGGASDDVIANHGRAAVAAVARLVENAAR